MFIYFIIKQYIGSELVIQSVWDLQLFCLFDFHPDFYFMNFKTSLWAREEAQ